MSETLFIADLHLSAERQDLTQLFLRFMAERAVQADTLYILGDFFDAWIGDDDDDPFIEPIVTALADFGRDKSLYFMQGNRDFLLGEGFVGRCNGVLLQDPTVREIYGQRVLLTHGDTLCTGDIKYMQFRAQIRKPETITQFLGQGLAERRAYAKQLRSQSIEYQSGKPLTDVEQSEVERVLNDHDVANMIHGHTHRPAAHQFELSGGSANRWVVGDWHADHAMILSYRSDSGFALLQTFS